MCGKRVENLWWNKAGTKEMCSPCMCQHYPPTMTLWKFTNKLWNVDVGAYEQIENPEDLDWCGWFLRSEQETIYRREPLVKVIVYFMEYLGDYVCARCADYPYFSSGDSTVCKAVACKDMCKTKPNTDKGPVQSRYRKWLGV